MSGRFQKTFLRAAGLSLFVAIFGSAAAGASTIVKQFTFYDGVTPVASGSFSYDSALSGDLGYADLDTFSVTLDALTYDLSFVNTANNYVWFDYDTASNAFVPGLAPGFLGNTESLLSAILQNGSDYSGFFFDPLTDQSVANDDGLFCYYAVGHLCTADQYEQATSLTISPDPVPEPASWALFAAGLAALGFGLARRKHAGCATP